MPFELSHRSLAVLINVHPDLQKLTARALALSPLDFVVIQGLRTPEEEAKDIAAGLSQTNHSRHLTGHAIDFMALVDNKPCWIDDMPQDGGPDLHPYHQIAAAFYEASTELKIPIVWGGVWHFVDADHIELDRQAYP